MPSPNRRFETAADLANEDEAARLIYEARGYTVSKVEAILYQIDWVMTNRDGELAGWAEYKRRSRKYDTLIIGLSKLLKGIQLSQYSGKPYYIFITWPDGLHYIKINNDEQFPITLARSDRVHNGKEPMVEIPVSRFKLVEAKA